MVDPEKKAGAVVVGVDGSDAGERAARLAGRLAQAQRAHLTVAYVVPWSPYSVQTAEDNEHRRATKAAEEKEAQEHIVDPLVTSLAGEGVQVDGLVRHGQPAEVLCEIASERGAAHLLVGRRGQSRVKTLLFGSTPGNLIQIATVPVTVVP